MNYNYVVDINWDDEAGVWTAVCDEIPLALESNSYDGLIERVKVVAQEMIEENAPKMGRNILLKSERLVACG